MISLPNGHNIEYLASSGALAYDGRGYWWEQPLRWVGLLDVSLFTPVTKTLTYLPNGGNCKRFNPFSCIRFVKDGVLNSFGLGNPGIDWWIKNHREFSGIVSIYPENDYTLGKMLRKLQETNVIGIELNVSCPNVGRDSFCSNVHNIEYFLSVTKSNTTLPIIVKLGVGQDIGNLFPQIEKYVDAISIKSVPWNVVFPNIKSPFEELGGGALSGKIIQPYIWNFINKLKEITDIPIIGSSIWEYKDIRILRENLKVSAISFGSIFLRYPWRPTEYIRRFENQETKYGKRLL